MTEEIVSKGRQSNPDEMTEGERKYLFVACFLALSTASFAFVFRVIELPIVIESLNLDKKSFGQVFGASLWPVAITMLLFSLLVDKIGHKKSIFIAFILQLVSVFMTMFASTKVELYISSLMAGLGWGVVEAVINPVCVSLYKHDKAKMLNILHAAWPTGMVVGGIAILITPEWGWKPHIALMLLPLLAYGVMFYHSRFPDDERIQANVSYRDMLKEFGGLGFFLATTFLSYEVIRLIAGESQELLYICLVVGILAGVTAGSLLKSSGKLMFFLICVLMVPLATTELGTDAWIKDLMQPVFTENWNIDAGWAIVFSASIMMVLRFYAGVLLKRLSPPALLMVSCLFSTAGLILLSKVSDNLVLLAFVLYAVGQAYLWATMLGFVSEQFPKGGALTLNMVTATGMLAVGIIGGPFLGAVQDQLITNSVIKQFPAVYDRHIRDDNFLGYRYEKVEFKTLKKAVSVLEMSKLNNAIDLSKRKAFFVAAILPAVMAFCFLLLMIYFRAKGGYRPVILHLD